MPVYCRRNVHRYWLLELITDVIRSVLAKDDDVIIPLTERMGEEQLAGRIEQELVRDQGFEFGTDSQIIQLLRRPLDEYLQDKFFQTTRR